MNAATERQRRRFLHTWSPQWRAIRSRVLAEEPLCRYCTMRGWVTPATEVDHADNRTENNSRDNLIPACKSCHSEKTAAEAEGRMMKGCDVNGWPIDPRHPWNATENRQSVGPLGTPPQLTSNAKATDK